MGFGRLHSCPLTVVYCLADVAVGAPFGGETKQGAVFVFPGGPQGLGTKPSQVLLPLWPAGHSPDFFGSALRGGSDLDGNGYPGEFPDPEHLSFPRTPGAVPGWHRQRALSPHSASWAAGSWLGACLKGHFLTVCRSHCGILRCGQGRGIQVRTPGVWELEDLTVELRPGKCLEDSGLLGLEHPLCPGSRGALALLIPHLLLQRSPHRIHHCFPHHLPCLVQPRGAQLQLGGEPSGLVSCSLPIL